MEVNAEVFMKITVIKKDKLYNTILPKKINGI